MWDKSQWKHTYTHKSYALQNGEIRARRRPSRNFFLLTLSLGSLQELRLAERFGM